MLNASNIEEIKLGPEAICSGGTIVERQVSVIKPFDNSMHRNKTLSRTRARCNYALSISR